MSTVNMTLSELQYFLNHAPLPSETRLTITFDDNKTEEIQKRKRAIEAMKKLRGSGNGNLVNALLRERIKDKLK
jgi:hypothetical protein